MAGIVFLVLMFGLAWVVLILPQQRRVKAQQAVVAALQEGDEVMTTSGIFGTVMLLDGDVVHLQVADGVEVRIARGAIARRLVEPAVEPEDTADDPVTELDDADDVDPAPNPNG